MRHALNQVFATVSAGLFLAFGAVPAHAQNLPDDFVFLRDIDPSIRQDIRYAGVNNFVGRKLSGYDSAECVVKRPVGLALQRVQRELMAQNLSLKMLDCYRPRRASRDMVAWARDGNETPAQKRYNPAFSKVDLFRLGYIAERSGHSTGAALDLTLVDLHAPCVAGIRSEQGLCKLHRAGSTARARGQRRHGHGLRLLRCQGAYRIARDLARAAALAGSPGNCDGQAGLCELFQGMVALLAAGHRRARLRFPDCTAGKIAP
jgi:D-alanyl-D-alanine dipeptidase